MIGILQGNLNRSWTAHNLLAQLSSEKNADIVLISEQYRIRAGVGWFADDLGTAAIWIPNPRNFHISDHGSGCGFVWIKHGGVYYVSVYLTPNDPIDDFQAKLNGLEDAILDMQGDLLVAGDFNAKALEWGGASPDSRGRRVMDMVSRLELVVLNTDSTSTFRRPGCAGTVLDITLASERLASRIANWRVIEDFTGSDHQYIAFGVRDGRPVVDRSAHPPRWIIAKMDLEKLSSALERGRRSLRVVPENLSPTEQAKIVTASTMRIVKRACAEAVPRVRPNRQRRPVYWWTDEIANLRSKCLRLRRMAQRARRRDDPCYAPLFTEFLAAKKHLKRTIRASQQQRWKELGEDIENDPWGLGYRIVTRKLGAYSQGSPRDAVILDEIVRTLFPTHPKRAITPTTSDDVEVPLFTEEELHIAVSSLRNKKAPGPDGLPTELLKAVAQSDPSLLLEMYNSCLKAGIFPAPWKTARLVLISKGKGPADAPTSYRPLCMLDTAGKLLEKLIRPRLHEAIHEAGGLAGRQYGFRPGRSTIQAIQEVVSAARATERGNHYSRPVCLLVTLDVRNAFNSVRWDLALHALERDFGVPRYLLRILGDYLNERFLTYETDGGSRRTELTSGAAQGSILGPDVWNIFYDGILRMDLPEGAFLVGYADDVAATIIARDVDEARDRLNEVMRRVVTWMRSRGLELAANKTEIVLLTKKRIVVNTPHTFDVEGAMIKSKAAIKYLGVTLDNKLTFWEHIKGAADKAASVVAALSRLMANVRGPRPCKRRLLMRASESVMLYGAEVWADSMRYAKYRQRIASVQRRGALRIASSYRTVSEPAVLVIAGVIPIDLMVQERQFVYREKPTRGKLEAVSLARAASIRVWQDRWNQESRGRWTARLISQLEPWINREQGEVNYYLTQFLTGHGLFRAYLYKMRKVAGPECFYGDSVSDDVHHTFFQCVRWTIERDTLRRDLGCLAPDTIIGAMLRGAEEWARVASFVEDILRKKRAETNGF